MAFNGTSVPVLPDPLRGRDGFAIGHAAYTVPQPPLYDMHYALEFGVLLSGRVRRFCGGCERAYVPGDAWFQGTWEPHGYELLALPTTAFVCFASPQMLVGTGLGEAPDYDWLAPFIAPPERRPQAVPQMRGEQLALAGIVGRAASWHRSELWYRLLFFEMMLLAREGWVPPPKTHAPHPDSYRHIDRAIRIAMARPRSATANEAAKACGMSRNAFDRVFTALMGITFTQYCLRHRLSVAAGQLLRTDDPIKVIASDEGFADASHFSRCFRGHYGCSPAQYRRQRRGLHGARQQEAEVLKP